MRKVLPYLGASLSLLAAMWATSAKAQDATTFKDVPTTHWAYQAVSDLQSKGILTGYPDGYFRGKRTLTRYEFAIALERALSKIQLMPGPAGPAGADGQPGPPGPVGPPGVTPEELEELKALTQEFKNDLAQLGANVKDIQARLDALAKDVEDIKDQLRKMPKITGEIFTGFRSNRSRLPFYDYSGAYQSASNTLTGNVDSVHDVHIGVTANLPGGVKALVDLVSSNYLGYRNSGGIFLGGPPAANGNGSQEEVTAYQAALQIPIGHFGSNTTLTVGRFKNEVTPLTYFRPDTDAYFNLPWYDDGNYVEDGFKLQSKFGSASTELWAGSYTSLTSTSGQGLINQPIVGANYGPRTFTPFKPTGIDLEQGQILPNESLGLHIGIPLFKFGEVGFTAIDFGGGTAGAPVVGPYYNNVVVYGANVTLKKLGRLSVSGEAAKSVNQIGIGSDASAGQSNEDNNAYTLNVGYNSGPIGLQAGYQYIDPRFGAPGYWNKLGNWYNPTNIKGPFVRLNYKLNNALLVSVGGDYYEGARNRVYGYGDGTGIGITTGSNIYRGTAGLKYALNKYISLNAEYEGVLYDLSPGVSASGNGRANLTEQYITLGAGLNLASNTVLSLGYQIINQQNVDGSFGGIGGTGELTSNASVLTTQLAVHF